jgi:hypothetical protein
MPDLIYKSLTTVLLFILFAFVISCSRTNPSNSESQVPKITSEIDKAQKNQHVSARTLTTATCGSCDAGFSGNHSGTGNFVYTPIQLDLSCADSNSSVTVACTYYDVPNAFDILDKSNNVVVSSGWIGRANCFGPWGSSINTGSAMVNIGFTYNPSLAPYKLRVQTTVIGCGSCGPNNTGCTSSDDTWDASIFCTRNDRDSCGTVHPPCGSCFKWYNDTHSGIGSYTYTPIQLDLSCAQENWNIRVGGIYYDVPNAFDVLDNSNNVVVSTGWIGNANCSGPWGSSISTLNAETYINFTYHAALAPYKLRVQTVISGCSSCGPNNVGCTSTDDNWGANVECSAP